MKLKRQPDDFQVEELPLVTPGNQGRFVFYRLSKRGLGTLEAVEAICRRWNLAGRRVSYGGLKDRHARTVQYLTIIDGPERALHETSFDLEPLGRLSAPYGPGQFHGNRFVVVLRDLSAPAVERALAGLASLPRDGLPNYFDDQRFGSVGSGGEFIAAAWLRGRSRAGPPAGPGRAEPGRSARDQGREGNPPRVLGPLARGQGAAGTVARAEPGDLPGRPSRRLPGRLRPTPPRAPLALLLGVPEPSLEPDARALDRADDAARAAGHRRFQGRFAADPPRPRPRPGRGPRRWPHPPPLGADAAARGPARRGGAGGPRAAGAGVGRPPREAS